MKRARIALICEKPENMFHVGQKEDETLRQYLTAGPWEIETRQWNEPDIDWKNYDLVLLKSPFDYHHHYTAFIKWLKQLDKQNIPLLNPYRIVTWNADKHYLKDLAAAGFNVIPSRFLEKGEHMDIPSLLDAFDTDKLIVKPCISGGSKNTFVIDAESATREIDGLLESGAYIVQPFVPEIRSGECSLLFFGGRFSHSIIKKPADGEFRVQPQYGGSIHVHTPDPKHIREAERLLGRFAKDALYARVDGVIVGGEFMLMELELIEPILYLDYTTDGYTHYIEALRARI